MTGPMRPNKPHAPVYRTQVTDMWPLTWIPLVPRIRTGGTGELRRRGLTFPPQTGPRSINAFQTDVPIGFWKRSRTGCKPGANKGVVWLSARQGQSHCGGVVRDASMNPQVDRIPGMMRPGTEIQWGTVQPEITISHLKIKRVRCAAATTKNTMAQNRKNVF